MLNLQHQCIHPTSNEPYIVSAKGGRDNSSEGMQVNSDLASRSIALTAGLKKFTTTQQGITHGFVVEFKSAEDRDYYVESDPAHSRFKASLKDIVTKAQVVDFAPNTY